MINMLRVLMGRVNNMHTQIGNISRKIEILSIFFVFNVRAYNPLTEMKWSFPPMKTHKMRNSPKKAKGFTYRVVLKKQCLFHLACRLGLSCLTHLTPFS